VLRTDEQDFLDRMKHDRASVRLNSRVKIALKWHEAGETHRAEGYTMDISPKGCMAIVAQGFAVGQRMKLTNLVNQKVVEASVIWRGHEGRAGWELGIELQEPPFDFWEVDF